MNTIELPTTSLLSKNISVITRMRGNDKMKSLQKSLSITSNLNDSKSNINKSKTSQFKNIKSEPNVTNKKIKDNVKYTMFTSNDSSNIMLVSKKPIKGSTINEALKVCNNLYEFHNSILNETTLLEYDKIYNETHSIEKIYNEVIKDNIVQLFNKKNSCVLFFGPSSSGKSYLFLGEKEENGEKIYNYNSKISKSKNNKKLEGGLLKRSINHLLNLIKMNKQGNDIKDNIQNKYEIKLSIYQIYMDKIYDLLNKKIINISIQKFYDDDEAINISLVGLTDVKISSIQEYEKSIKDAEFNRKNLPQILKVKNLNKNSHIIISLKLQRIIQNKIGNNISDNYTINSFSQIDFVELISSEIGLNDNFQDNNNDLSYEFSLYNNTKNVYNSIIDNIICANNGTTPKNETILTLSLKNTLKTNSNIIFFNCVIPWEYPVNNSYKSLKFATWLRNQVINERENMNNDNISTNNINPNSVIMNNTNNLFNTINDTTTANSVINQNINNNYLINNQNPPFLAQNNNDITNQNYNNQNHNSSLNNLIAPSQSIDNGKKKNNFIMEEQKADNNFNINEEKNIKLMRSHSGGRIINNNKNIYHYKLNDIKDISNINNNNSLSQELDNINQNNKNQFINPNDKTLITLENTLKELEEKKLEIEKKIYQEKNRNNYNPNMNISMPISSSQNIINREDQKFKEEQDILKSDNIIMKEDINRLNEININLENEITKSRDIISDLQSVNQSLIEENSSLKSRLNDYENNNYIKKYVNGQISKEDFLEKNCNERFKLECKLKDIEHSYNILQKEKTQYEVDFKVLLSKYDEIKEKYEKSNYELMNNKQMHDNELCSIDNKINILSKEVERLQMENSELRYENEKFRENFNIITSERDMYKDKLEGEKYKNEILNKKIFDVENGYNIMMREKEYERYYGRNKEENHKNNKSETKKQIAQVLQNRIQQYRRERLQRKQNEDFD